MYSLAGFCSLGSFRTFAFRILLLATTFVIDRWWILRRHVIEPASAAHPRFVRSLRGREYRFVGPKDADKQLRGRSQGRLLFAGAAHPLFRAEMWLWLLKPVRLTVRKVALLMIPLVVGVAIYVGERPSAGNFGGLYDWPTSTHRWFDNLNLLTSDVTFNRKAEEARRAAQLAYGLSPKMVEALRDSSIQVDPFETSLVWAYQLPWKPVPIFQTYQVYANDLDEFNTQSLSRRGTSDAVLINSDYVENIDGRLSLWTSPRDQLSLTCSWSLELRDGSWEKWVKAEDRCGSPELITSTTVVANERVVIPRASADSLVVAKFESSSSNNLISSAIDLLYKPLHEFKVQLGDRSIREPRAFDSAPLIVSCPPNSLATNRYAAVCPSPDSIAFSESGTVTFERIPISPR